MADFRILSIAVENFRGVRGRVVYDLDAPVILFWGPNGTGKTTVFDAFTWLVLGDIPRLHSLALRQTDDYITNSYGRGAPAEVEVVMVKDGTTYRAVRRGSRQRSILEVDGLSGPSEEALDQILTGKSFSLGESLFTSGLLQQDDLRLMMRDKPSQRYRQLLRLLGLENLERFDQMVKAWLKASRDHERSALASLDAARARQSEAEENARLLAEMAERSVTESDDTGFRNVREEVAHVARVRESPPIEQVAAAGSVFLRAVDEIQADLSSYAYREYELIPDDRLREIANQIHDAEGEVVAAEARLHALEEDRRRLQIHHQQLASLADLAIPLLHTGPADEHGRHACPVCETKVAPDTVADSLARRASGSNELSLAINAVERARGELASGQQLVASLRVAHRHAVDERSAADAQESRAREIVDAALALLNDGFFEVPGLQAIDPSPEASMSQWLGEHKQGLMSTLSEARTAVARISDSATQHARRAEASRLVSSESDDLRRANAAQSSLRIALEQRRSEYETRSAQYKELNEFATITASVVQEIVSERFGALEPLLNDIYARLDPHPTFKRLSFSIERFRSQGTATPSVFDDEEELAENPLLIFSSAQANIVALSAFLAMGWAAGRRGLPFVLMDDPLQSLDDVNVLGFADVLLQLRDSRQVVLSTHEDRFARLLERKFRKGGNDVIVHRFHGWDRDGPIRSATGQALGASLRDHTAS